MTASSTIEQRWLECLELWTPFGRVEDLPRDVRMPNMLLLSQLLPDVSSRENTKRITRSWSRASLQETRLNAFVLSSVWSTCVGSSGLAPCPRRSLPYLSRFHPLSLQSSSETRSQRGSRAKAQEHGSLMCSRRVPNNSFKPKPLRGSA